MLRCSICADDMTFTSDDKQEFQVLVHEGDNYGGMSDTLERGYAGSREGKKNYRFRRFYLDH